VEKVIISKKIEKHTKIHDGYSLHEGINSTEYVLFKNDNPILVIKLDCYINAPYYPDDLDASIVASKNNIKLIDKERNDDVVEIHYLEEH
jgi:hypothetical protein